MFFFNRRSDEQVPMIGAPEKFWIQPLVPLVPTRMSPTTWSLVAGADVPIPTLTPLPNTIVLETVATALAPMAVAFVSPALTLALAPTAVLLLPVIFDPALNPVGKRIALQFPGRAHRRWHMRVGPKRVAAGWGATGIG